MTVIDFYTRPGCHLCREALQVLRKLQREFQFDIRVVDISGSPELEARYGVEIPVAALRGETIFKHRADAARLRRFLRRVESDPQSPD